MIVLQTPHLIDSLPSLSSLDPDIRLDSRAGSLLRVALGGYVLFLPVQIEGHIMNFAPSDLFLIVGIIGAVGALRLVSSAWSLWHAALTLSVLVGTFMTFSRLGVLTSYVFVKVAGLFLLFASYALVTTVAKTWVDIRWILKVFLIGVVLNAACALVAYLLPHGIPGLNYGRDRLSGALLDPNAFGGIVMVALVVHGMTYRSAKPLIGGIRGAVL